MGDRRAPSPRLPRKFSQALVNSNAMHWADFDIGPDIEGPHLPRYHRDHKLNFTRVL